jgi:hypothetical protein
MTVKELIARLREMPQDMEIGVQALRTNGILDLVGVELQPCEHDDYVLLRTE